MIGNICAAFSDILLVWRDFMGLSPEEKNTKCLAVLRI